MTKTSGRPPKGKDKRYNKVTVAFNDTEYDIVNMRAEKAQSPIATYCRKSSLTATVKAPLSPEALAAIKNFHRLGNNLNQLVHKLNGNVIYNCNKDVEELFIDYRKLREDLRKYISINNDC